MPQKDNPIFLLGPIGTAVAKLCMTILDIILKYINYNHPRSLSIKASNYSVVIDSIFWISSFTENV